MRLWADNAAATIADNPLSAGAGTINLATGKGSLFPSPSGGDFFKVTLTQSGTESSWEEVTVTSRSGDVLTLSGTVANTWAQGSKCEIRLTADWLKSNKRIYKTFAAAHG